MDVFALVAKLSLDSSEYDAGLETAEKKGSGFGGALKKGAVVAAGAVAAAGAAAVAFGKEAVQVGANFDASMSQVAATMGVTTDQIGELREFAQEMGRTTAFSASQAADALNYMALAGYDAETSMQMLPNVLNLAAAGGIELATASDMITDAQSALGLTLGETSEMVDQMAKASSKSNTSVQQLGDAILTIGATARNVSGGTTELSTVLGVLADNGIKGAEGGTHLRNVLLSLQTPSDKGAAALEKLGMTYDDMYDSMGNMRSLPEIFQQMSVAMEGMSQQAKDAITGGIFNKTDLASVNALLGTSKDRWEELDLAIAQSRGTTSMSREGIVNLAEEILYNFDRVGGLGEEFHNDMLEYLQFEYDMDPKAVEEVLKRTEELLKDGKVDADALADAIEGVSGAAGAMADTQLDNLTGDITLMKSAFEGLQIAVSDRLTPALRGFVQFGGEAFSTLTEAFQAEGLLGALSSLGDMLMQAGLEAFSKLTEGAQNALPELIPLAMDALVNFSGNLRENAGQLIDAGIELIMTLATSLIDNIPTLIKTVPTIISNLAGIINDNAPKLIACGIELIGKLIAGIIKSVPTLIAEFPKIVKAIADVITAFNWLNLGKHIITFIKNGIQALFTTIPNLMKNIGNNALNIVKNINWKNLGTQIITFIVNGIKALVNSIPNALKSIGTSAVNAFKSIDWLELGKNVISGIVSGITGGVGRVIDAAKEAASSAFNAAKSLLGIASPSKKFMWVGRMIDEGFAGGIDKYSGLVEDSVGKLADVSLDPFDGQELSVSGTAGAGAGAAAPININVYGTENQSPREIAEEVSRILKRQYQSSKMVYGNA